MVDTLYRSRRLLALVLCLIVVWGFSAYRALPRMEDPPISQRMGLVVTQLSGASADQVEALVSVPIEKTLDQIAEIDHISATSIHGRSTLWIELQPTIPAANVPEVWSRVRDRLSDVYPLLPASASIPQYQPIEPRAYSYIGALVWDQESTPNYTILNRWMEAISTEIRQIPGTETVDWIVHPDEEIQIKVDDDRLAALGLTPQQLAQQIRNSDAKVDAGELQSLHRQFPIKVSGELTALDQIQQLLICGQRCQQGEDLPIRLHDLAMIQKGVKQPLTVAAQIAGKPAVVFAVLLHPDQQIEVWSTHLHQSLDSLRPQLPERIQLTTVFEQTPYVSKRLDSLFMSLMLGAVLVFGVTLVLMGWRSALIIGVSLPLTVMVVLGSLQVLNIPLHQMSVMGLVIALGLLIDNAIVVVDETQQRLAAGIGLSQAIAQTIQQLAIPLFASTVTTVLSFLPIALISGDAGEFVRDIAISVILALTVSFVLSLSVILALMRQIYRLPTVETWWNNGFCPQSVVYWYRSSLRNVYGRPWLGIGLALMFPVMGFTHLNHLAVQFFPPSDRDQVHIELRLPPATPLSETAQYTQQVRQSLLKYDQISEVQWLLGTDFPAFYYNLPRRGLRESNFAHALVQLNTNHERDRLIQTVQNDLNHQFPSAQMVVRQLDVGPYVPAPISLSLYGPDLTVLQTLGDQIRTQLTHIPEVTQTRAVFSELSPQLTVNLNPDQSQALGLDHRQIAHQLATGLEGYTGGTVLEGTTELPIRVLSTSPQTVEQLATFDLLSASSPTTLDAVGNVTLDTQPATLQRFDGRRVNIITAFVAAGVLPSQVQSQLNQRLTESGFQLPSGYELVIEGEQQARQEATQRLMRTARILVVVIIAVLVLSFNSFRAAGLIGIVGAASVGIALLLLSITGYPLGFMPILGTVGLVGVAINDSIVVLAALQANPLARRGDRSAMVQVVCQSTRHVLATTITTIAGFIPLFLTGGAFWIPLGLCIAGGVGGTTLLALLFIPCAYQLLNNPISASTWTGQLSRIETQAMDG